MRTIEEVFDEINTLLSDRRVARLELYRDQGEIHARLIVHEVTDSPYRRSAVGARGRGVDAIEALRGLTQFTQGGSR